MKTKLITALRLCASALRENRFAYNWRQPNTCNVGVLYCALTGTTAYELAEKLRDMRDTAGATWTKMAGYYCPIAGQPNNEIFKALMANGLSQSDITELEYCRNAKVLKRMGYRLKTEAELKADKQAKAKELGFFRRLFTGINVEDDSPPSRFYATSSFVADYMSAWADLLVEEGQQDIPEQKGQHETTGPNV